MNIQFLGAVQEVTGSAYLLKCGGKKILVDCGFHQGRNEDKKNQENLSVEPSELDVLLLTHGHIDHSGRIPWLVSQGFRGRIWATSFTTQLLPILWYDSARLMKEEAEWKSKKNSRKALPPVRPLYTEDDVTAALALLQPVDYGVTTEIFPHLKACYYNAGHILGSASIALKMEESGQTVRIVFSGDLGQQQAVMERTPEAIREADYVLIESTYGNRLHKSQTETRKEFREVILEALRDRGKVLIPSFVIDRAQRVLYELLLMQIEGLIPEKLPIFFDSPMGVKATEFYRRGVDTLSDDIRRLTENGYDPFMPEGLTFVSSAEQSKEINDVPFGIVIAGSGMCTGGRIIHHLKHGVWNPKNHVIFVGYQAYGTLGRRLVDGEKELRIAGEDVTVRARMHTIGGFSAHGDRDDLLAWAENFETAPLFFVTHGESTASHALAASLRDMGTRAIVPAKGQEFSLVSKVVHREVEETAMISSAVAVGEPSNEAVTALDDIGNLVDELRLSLKEAVNIEEILPLLVSTRTLLETADTRVRRL